MNPELEALVRAYDQCQNEEATETQRELLWSKYQALLQTTSERVRVSTDALHAAIRDQRARWVRAQSRPSSLPPKA